MMPTFAGKKNLTILTKRVLELYPAYAKFIEKRFADCSDQDLTICDGLAGEILQLSGKELDAYCVGFDFICKIQREEEIYFRRTGDYRLKTFDEAYRLVYSNKPYMTKYMQGLLLTQVFWSNHTQAINFYGNTFLSGLAPQTQLLEVGPGHGLLFAKACKRLGSQNVTGWDISEASLEDTARSLNALRIEPGYRLISRDIMNSGTEKFGAIVFSEVLEHMENPAEALRALGQHLGDGGRLFINVPLNSPAPDHLFLLRSSQETEQFVHEAGFGIVEKRYFPATNYSLEQSERHQLTINACLVLAIGA
jgi:2-polyprenyl-3-methyl-5-hydroxy-6-metoxy-1,4-benzoquinol methylase